METITQLDTAPPAKAYYLDEVSGEISCASRSCAGMTLSGSIESARKGQRRFRNLRGYSVLMTPAEVAEFASHFDGKVCNCEMYA